MRIAVLGPGGVGGLLAGALARAGNDVEVVAREQTAAVIARDGLEVRSVTLGEFVVPVRVGHLLEQAPDALIVATKATGLEGALERIAVGVPLVLPLLNGLDHLVLLRERFGAEAVLAGSIRVESDRPQPAVIVHTSPFLLVSMASGEQTAAPAMAALARTLSQAGVPAKVRESEAEVMWSKLVRLNALACTTSAHDVLLGEIRSTPRLRAELEGAMQEAAAVARAEGDGDADVARAMAELDAAHATLGSSMQRDIAAGREPELDAIPGAVLRAAARHRIPCPTIEGLVAQIRARIDARAVGVPARVSEG